MISYFSILQTFLVLETRASSNQHQLNSSGRKIKVQLVRGVPRGGDGGGRRPLFEMLTYNF